jgi:hypothetical protein
MNAGEANDPAKARRWANLIAQRMKRLNPGAPETPQ